MLRSWPRAHYPAARQPCKPPRAAKSFVNFYRLIRATVSESWLLRFERSADRGGEYQAALLLLAVLASFSDQAYDVFNVLSQGRATGSWWDFVRRLKPVKMRGSDPLSIATLWPKESRKRRFRLGGDSA